MGYLVLCGVCFLLGSFLTWVWLTEYSPFARKATREYGVQVLCAHCGRMYWTGYNNVRTANYCNKCK